jgi:hypothetical protein
MIIADINGLFDPGRQELEIEQFGRLDGGRCHRLHLLE